ncbi:MAG: HAMP domain-containing histidine kinase [Elusimicrobia bacterium]|nr:HAMP domain-containing histidine kinase [Elusimicrobiota bacterium]
MSIRTKILLFMLLLMSAIVGTLSLSLYYTEKNILERAEYTRQQQVILAWTQVCRETPPQLGSSDGAHYFDKFFAAPSILERHCIDKTGKIYLSANPTNLGRQAANVTFRTDYPPNDMGFISEAVLPDHRAVIQVDTPIRVRQNEPVLARLVFSKKELNSKMEQKLREASARIYVVSAIALIVGCIGILFLTAFFSNPIQTLISGVRLIGSGNLEHAIIIPGRTEFSALANEINLMARKLRELDKMKSDFTSGITHDLRSPVTGIKLCASNILDEYKTKSFPKIPEQTLHILEYAERLNRFIDSLLEVAKIESGKSHLRISTANLEDIAARVVDSYRPYAQQKKLQVNLVVEHELADISVDIDKI